MITQSEEGKRAEKWLTDAFRGEFSEFHIISLANEFTKHAAEARAEQREISKEACLLTVKCAKALQQQDCADAVSEYLATTEYKDGAVRACLAAIDADVQE